MTKQEIKDYLTSQGYKGWKNQGEIYFMSQAVGECRVYFYLSNKLRIFIETAGTGTYYIKLKEINFSFKTTDKVILDSAIKSFKERVKVCEIMNRMK